MGNGDKPPSLQYEPDPTIMLIDVYREQYLPYVPKLLFIEDSLHFVSRFPRANDIKFNIAGPIVEWLFLACILGPAAMTYLLVIIIFCYQKLQVRNVLLTSKALCGISMEGKAGKF